ncbi:MAG: hypothetical protein K0R66_350 [Gammaproteobacteria bacterium]|jgi:hypothetical protein|nr:hypothetical protein [Gammaproteobacteria bacterium]
MDNTLPESCCVVKSDNECYFMQPTIIRDLHNLRFSLKDRLIQAKQIIHKHKKNLRDFFSNNDKILIQTNIDKGVLINNKFLQRIVKNNLVKYDDNPSKYIDEILAVPKEKLVDREPQTYITKWFNFSNDDKRNQSIVNTIISNQLYTKFPEQFYDIFDAQLRCSDEIIRSLAEKYVNFRNIEMIPKEQQIIYKSRAVEFRQDFFNSSLITCFSKADPISFNSHHMWAQYGEAGKGFALQYDISLLDNFLIEENTQLLRAVKKDQFIGSTKIYDYCRIYPVTYQNACPLMSFFDPYLSEVNKRIMNKNSSQERLTSLQESFFSTKHPQWQHEQEIRLVTYHFFLENEMKNNNYVKEIDYINDAKGPEKFKLMKKKFYDAKKNILPFIKPSKIVLGWDYESSTAINHLEKLIQHAHSNNIEIGRLDKSVNYLNNQFTYSIIKSKAT